MNNNQKQAPSMISQPQPRYAEYNISRTDPYHVGTPQTTYIPQPPPNQGSNQVQSLRGMPSTGPPNQASTPPNADIKVQMQPQQTSMNLAIVPQIPVRGPAQNVFPRAPQPSTQSSRMANHRQGQQHIFQTQPQYVPIMQTSVPFINPSTPYFNGAPRPQPGFVATPFQVISGHPAYSYPAPQTQSTTYYYNPAPMIQRQQLSSVTAVQPNPTQPPAPAMTIPAQPQQVNVVGSNSRRRRHAIPIIDPNTGKELNEMFGQDDSHPASGESSARQTPQPPLQNSKEVQAAFARQVTEAIKDKELPIIDDFEQPIIDTMGHMYPLPPQAVPHQRFESIIQTSKLQVATKEFVPAALNNTAKETPVVSAITDAVEVTITNKPKDRESPVKARKQREAANITLKEPVSVIEKEDLLVCEKPIAITTEEVKPKDNMSTNIVPIKETVVTSFDKKQQKKETSKPVSTMPVAVVEEANPVADEVLPEFVPLSNVDTLTTSAKSKQASLKNNEFPKPQQPLPLPPSQPHPQPHVTTTTPPVVPVVQKTVHVIPPPVPLTQPTKPNNKRNKMQEINIKGALKEGTDMDAFNDNSEENNITNTDYINSDYVNIDNNTTLNNNEDSNKNSDITTIKPIIENKPKSKFDVTDIVKDVPKPIKPITIPLPTESPDEVDRAVLANEKLVQAKNEANAKANADFIDTNPPETKLGLPYREDQWSPSNPDGKKVYGYEFLMALKNDPKSKQRPDNIPNDILALDTRGRGTGDVNRYAVGGRQTDFAPNFGNNVYANKNSQRGTVVKRRSQQGASGGSSSIKQGSRPSVIRVSISVKEDVKLREVENAWRPARLVVGENVTEDDIKTASLYKKVRGVLNKLTPQKFSQLLEQVKAFEIDTTQRLQGVIDLVFEKAVDEPNFSVAYANLCQEVSMMQVPVDTKRKPKDGQPVEYVNFRKLLVTRCQLEFEKNSIDESVRNEKLLEIDQCEDPEKKKDMQLDLDEYDRKLRMKSVGNIRFIGELFKQNMLTANIMLRCLNNLLTNKDEESLECLCKLLSTVGKELEIRKVDLNPIFIIMKEIVDRKHGKISSRVRFMIQDVIDLRQSEWIPRRQDFNPKTMDQIQKDAENEQLEIQALNAVPITPRKDDRVTSGGGGGGSMHSNERRNRRNAGNNEDGGWTTQTRSNRTQFNVMSDKLKTVTPMHDEPLGNSGMFGNWSGGANVKPVVTSSNIYSALENLNTDNDKRTASMGMRHGKDHYNSKGPSLERSYRHHYDDNRGSRSGSQHRLRDNNTTSHISTQQSSISNISIPQTYAPPSVQTAVMPRDQPAAIPPVAEMTPEQFDIQLRKILEDYLTDSDIAECDCDIKKAFPPSELPKIVTEGYNSVLERSKTARWGVGQLFANLIKLGTLSPKDYCTGLTNCLSEASDLIIDIPKLWTYLGELIAPVLCEGVLAMRDLYKCCDTLINENHAHELLAPLFNLIIQEKCPNFLHNLWNTSGLKLSNFMSESEVDKFIKKNEFECLLHADSASSYKSNSNLSQQEIYNKLVTSFKSHMPFDDIVNWITANVGEGVKQLPFIRTLATACFEESIVKDKFKFEILKNRLNLILRYVDAKPEYELQCLFAIQALVNRLQYPMGLVVGIFDKIYEENIFSHESFLTWELSSDPAEQEGKGVALKQLTSFFTHLKEVDEDSCGSSEETGG